MSFGKLYTYEDNSRSLGIRAVIKENKLDVELVKTLNDAANQKPEYLALNPLGRIPTFVGADGFVLTESIAIAVYLTSQNEKTTLLGKTKQDYANILKWMSLANSHVLPNLATWFGGLNGKEPYNKKNVDTAQAETLKAISVFEKHLVHNTFLVGERLTLADLYAAGQAIRGFDYVFDTQFRDQFPAFTRWYTTIYHSPAFSAISPKAFEPIKEAIKYTPPKKEAAPKKEAKKEAPKAEKPKPKAKEVEEDDDEPSAPQEKAKHPLETLGKPALAIDDWKRHYSNTDTRGVALPDFWSKYYDPKEWSLWRVDYKYNDELTQIFMTSNLIGGFFNRLEASRKYLFGSASVYGTANNSAVAGAFLVRGQEADPAFNVAPDHESYSFSKLDPSKPKDKEFVEDAWAWDKPLTVNGKELPWADGKVFK